MSAPYVLLSVAEKLIGLSVRAMELKIARGVWIDGKEYRKGPDGHIYVSMKGFESWVESARPG